MPTNLSASIGHYKIVKELGRSSFSTVYLAQPEDADKAEPVALKVLNGSAVASPEFLKQFRREVRLAAKLKHPHIIRVYSVNNNQRTPFVAMEYVAGGTLRERLKNSPLPRAEAVRIVEQIGAALSDAHTHQVIHGDVRPGNVLLDTTQNPVRSVLTDFGRVKELSATLLKKGDSPSHSPPVLEAYGYMAPEQWEPQSPLTPATDVYGLATTLFEMLAGRHPFEEEVLSKLRQKRLPEPLPLLSRVAYKIGPFFDQVLTRATAQDPANRYQRVADFVADVKAANEKVEQAERVIRQRRAVQAVKMARSYLTRDNYNLERALVLTEEALGMVPGYGEAQRLRGEIKLKQERFAEALGDYRQAYEQEHDPASAAGLDYLNALKQVAENFWQRRADQEAFKHYKVMKRILEGGHAEAASVQAWQEAWTRLIEGHHNAGIEAYTAGDAAYAARNLAGIARAQQVLEREISALETLQAGDESQDLQEKVRVLRVKHHHSAGDRAYAAGHPDDLAEAIEILEREIRALEALRAEPESRDLQDKARLLQVKKYQNIVRAEEEAIAAIHAQDSDAPYNNEAIFQHYFNLADAYQKLIELEPQNEQWLGRKERVMQECKYYEVQKLIADREVLQALPHLVENFINTGNYEYRDVAKLLWELVHAKQHDGKFPSERESVADREELEEVAPRANDHQQKLENLIKSPYLVLIVQALIIITSVMIGVILATIARNFLF